MIVTTQLSLHAWPNNLVFTLKPNNVALLDKVETDLPLFKEKDGQTYIGKFIHPDIAKRAQLDLQKKGFETEVLAFFRAKPLPMEDALTLVENFNSVEENTMLTGTSGIGGGSVTIQKVKDVNSAYFTIQVGVFSKSVINDYGPDVREVQVDNKYYYYYGKFNTIEESNTALEQLKAKGFGDAFVAAFSMGQKVNPELLQKMMKI
jgi:hypothetical protein